MNKHNQNNERIKRKYLIFLKQAKGQSEASIDTVAKAIARFENYNKYKDFKAFHFEQAIGFKKHLANQKHHRTRKPLSLATMNGTVRHLKTFVEWLSCVFQSKVATHSTPKLPLVPDESCHQFHSKAATLTRGV